MKRLFLLSAFMLVVSSSIFAGGLLTNTNQHVSFLRMIARGASIGIDGVYSNPAGLAFLDDGVYLSLNIQSAYQTRVIDADFALWEGTRRYKGTASAPVIPSFQAAYKKGDWTLSGSFAVTGGGGKASFDSGLPMFDSKIIAMAAQGGAMPEMYTINSAMDGKQFIYGLQLGLTYKVNDWLAVFAGGRMNYVNSGYEGYLDAVMRSDLGGQPLAKIALDCDQTGWGITPVIGADVKFGQWNLGMKYEFMTNVNIENKTKMSYDPNSPALEDALSPYAHGVNTPNDIPALLTAALGYNILPTLRASVEYHYFFDKQARMANISGTTTGKQKALTKGTNEYLAGVEWDVHKKLTVSAGYQTTDYGLSDDFQSDTSFSCDSYSVGLGTAIKFSPKVTLNVAYFWTVYTDYTKTSANYNGLPNLPGKDVYSRTNKVFGAGIDYKF
ncbi:OmpP1/FadL family transporter [Proteiniphilum sp. UBA5384]|uniref:OmpP1/FadL family transporter n=1 Tax=Proteiniphilum sp. UBA5384 TaxID=1947279 RepID=UPI0025F8450E|nr:hypothetical protein [Proteiniphilum sp. UBA5384]